MALPILGAMGITTGMLAQKQAHVGYYLNELCPNTLPDPNTLIDAYRRGTISEEQLKRGMNKLGYGPQAIDAMLASSEVRLSPAQVATLRTRGELSDSEYLEMMKGLGYNDEQADSFLSSTLKIVNPEEALKLYRLGQIDEPTYNNMLHSYGMDDNAIKHWEAINQYIPPPQDVVRFAVREALDPAAAEKLGLYEDIPPEFLDLAKQSGISEGDARRYWAAHWVLPSPSQSLEMYHRGEFGDPDSQEAKDTLAALYKAQDYSPAFRDQLEDISWSPYTRIDGSRMYLEGTIDEDELYDNYRSIGYDDEHAKKLVDYYKAKKEQAEAKAAESKAKKTSTAKAGTSGGAAKKAAAIKDKDISAGLIKNAYYYGEVSRDEAKNLIMKLDFDSWEADLHLDIWDAQLEEKDRKDEINFNTELYKRGLATETETRDALNSLGLSGVAIDTIILKNTNDIKINQRQPSRADFDRWLKKGLLTDVEYLTRLTLLNYSEDDVERYYAEAKGLV